LEFLLKLDEFKDLREVRIYPQAICPSQNESWSVIREMIDQGKKFCLLDFIYHIVMTSQPFKI